ncbi:alpha/beta hydrolase [Nocardia pseudovaccinii]|uniref:alpha/beta hydrolase n=1 Tax=Nocardia pseudovaccinii TaxID=189540 RepID=UPI001C3F88AE|nr:alpha/beta hydrolase [Nocardia pseudovaccinii]
MASRLVDVLMWIAQFRQPTTMRVREFGIKRTDGTRLRVKVYSPLAPTDVGTGLLWLHGGGYFLGRPDQDVPIYRRLIAATGCVVVAPDYRLSVDHPYPAALEDCYDALIWLRDNANRLGIRDDQIAVAGESAGGGLTAALTLLARDRGEVNIAFQMPIYPMIDDRVCTRSARDSDAPLVDTVTLIAAWKLYLGELYWTQRVPPYAAAARSTDLRGLPPTFTYVGDLEPFRDETVAYVDRLRSCGVPVDFQIYPGCWHGFDRLVPGADVSRAAMRSRERWLRHAVDTYFAAQPELDRDRA